MSRTLTQNTLFFPDPHPAGTDAQLSLLPLVPSGSSTPRATMSQTGAKTNRSPSPPAEQPTLIAARKALDHMTTAQIDRHVLDQAQDFFMQRFNVLELHHPIAGSCHLPLEQLRDRIFPRSRFPHNPGLIFDLARHPELQVSPEGQSRLFSIEEGRSSRPDFLQHQEGLDFFLETHLKQADSRKILELSSHKWVYPFPVQAAWQHILGLSLIENNSGEATLRILPPSFMVMALLAYTQQMEELAPLDPIYKEAGPPLTHEQEFEYAEAGQKVLWLGAETYSIHPNAPEAGKIYSYQMTMDSLMRLMRALFIPSSERSRYRQVYLRLRDIFDNKEVPESIEKLLYQLARAQNDSAHVARQRAKPVGKVIIETYHHLYRKLWALHTTHTSHPQENQRKTEQMQKLRETISLLEPLTRLFPYYPRTPEIKTFQYINKKIRILG